MALSEKVKKLIEEFIDSDTVQAVTRFSSTDENNTDDINLIAQMFGFSGNFTYKNDADKLINSFKNNLQLLIQKTWVEKSDIALKEEILVQLAKLCDGNLTFAKDYTIFLELISNAVYLMFGQQTKSEDFGEYSLRIDPEFGIFWWYISSLPNETSWSEDKCRVAMMLGMYFLANY